MTQQMADLMLPEPDTVILAYSGCSSEYIDGYERGFDDALDKMREYARRAVEAEREACAKVCEDAAIRLLSGKARINQVDRHVAAVLQDKAEAIAERREQI